MVFVSELQCTLRLNQDNNSLLFSKFQNQFRKLFVEYSENQRNHPQLSLYSTILSSPTELCFHKFELI